MEFNNKRSQEKFKLDQECFKAASFGNITNVIISLRKGANPNYVDERPEGWGTIHYAARWGDVKMLKALVYFDADINIFSKSRETALHVAAQWNRRDVVIYLMSKGANIGVVNREGNKAEDCTTDTEIQDIIRDWEDYRSNHDINLAALGKVKKYELYR